MTVGNRKGTESGLIVDQLNKILNIDFLFKNYFFNINMLLIMTMMMLMLMRPTSVFPPVIFPSGGNMSP